MSRRETRDHLRKWNRDHGAACWSRAGLPGTSTGKHVMSRATKDGEEPIPCHCGACSTGVKTTGKAKIGAKAA